mgnify:CR=1 FL=1
MSKLLIVESPTKANTIKRFLGLGYKVIASKGHVRDLPKSRLGVDVNNKFAPEYEIPEKALKNVKLLKSEAKNCDEIYLATDEDREGEAISYHIAYILNSIKTSKQKKTPINKYKRIVFHEITKDAITQAIKNPRTLDLNMVNSQQARRVLDRLVGYKLSPLLWKKIHFGLSAGRVQSAALRLIVERERERNKFIIKTYFNFLATFLTTEKFSFNSNLILYKGNKIVERKKGKNIFLVTSESDAKQIVTDALRQKYTIKQLNSSKTSKNPYPPFTTSTLQQALSNMHGFSATRTMRAAQKLYENGYITYHRTDSVALSSKFVQMAETFIKKSFGDKYLKTRLFKNKSKNAQEAHEAIRPTDLSVRSSILKLGNDEKIVYSLIYARSVATQMSNIEYLQSSLDIVSDNNNFLFRTSGNTVLFDGWSKIYSYLSEIKYNPLGSEVLLPNVKTGDLLDLINCNYEQRQTTPPPRYSEASLIKILEKYGIGRPSTYAPTIQTILTRKYVEKEGKYLYPTDMGNVVTKLLEDNFESIVDYNFTAKIESDLDNVATGREDWTKVVSDFYIPFEKKINAAETTLTRRDYKILDVAPSNIICPKCSSGMVVKLGKLGRFYSCDKFPDCDGVRFINGETVEDIEKKSETADFKKMYKAPPKTEDNRNYLLRNGRYGMFWAHPDYPKVKDAKPLEIKKRGLIALYGEIPKTNDGRDFVFKSGKFGKYWAHPDYPKVKEIIRIKNSTQS